MSAHYQVGCLRVPITDIWQKLNRISILICSNPAPPKKDLPSFPTDPCCPLLLKIPIVRGLSRSEIIPSTFHYKAQTTIFFGQFKLHRNISFVSLISQPRKHVRYMPEDLGVQVGVQAWLLWV